MLNTTVNFDNFKNSTSKIKAPAPNLSKEQNSNVQDSKKRQIKRPEVGVIDVPHITNMPLNDAVEIKRKENPFTKYKLTFKDFNKINLHTLASVVIGACSLVSLFSLIKKSR